MKKKNFSLYTKKIPYRQKKPATITADGIHKHAIRHARQPQNGF